MFLGYSHLRNPQGFSKWFPAVCYMQLYYRVPHTCVTVWGHHRFRQWLVAHAAPNHYLNEQSLMGTNFSECWTSTAIFPLKIHSKVTQRSCQPFCFGLNVLTGYYDLYNDHYMSVGRYVLCRILFTLSKLSGKNLHCVQIVITKPALLCVCLSNC